MNKKYTTAPAVTHEEGRSDAWNCSCGNNTDDGGFDYCTKDGKVCEPDSAWNGHYKCCDCGHFFHEDDVKEENPLLEASKRLAELAAETTEFSESSELREAVAAVDKAIANVESAS
jgi:hypothetical protein